MVESTGKEGLQDIMGNISSANRVEDNQSEYNNETETPAVFTWIPAYNEAIAISSIVQQTQTYIDRVMVDKRGGI